MRNLFALLEDIRGILHGVLHRDLCMLDYIKLLHVGLKRVCPFKELQLTIGKSGFDVIRFAFKRLPNQEPLVNGKGERMPEPDYDSEEWKGWEARLTEERAAKVVPIKKGQKSDT